MMYKAKLKLEQGCRLILLSVITILSSCNLTDPSQNPSPNMPVNPSPYDGAVNILPDTIISWSCPANSDDSISFNLYLDTLYEPEIFDSSITDTCYMISNLNLSKIYHWQVEAVNKNNERTISPVWSFSTLGPYFRRVGQYDVDPWINAISTSRNCVFVAFYQSYSLCVLDISNVSSPYLLTTYEIGDIREINDVETIDSLVYFSAYYNGIQALKLSDDNTFESLGTYNYGATYYDIELSSNTLVARTLSTIELVDISDRTNPLFLSFLDIERYVSGIHIDDEYLYFISSDNDFKLYDITDRSNPLLLSTLELTDSPVTLVIIDDYAFIGCEHQLFVADISMRDNPVIINTVTFPDNTISEMSAAESMLFISTGNYGILVLDISNPESVEIICTPLSPRYIYESFEYNGSIYTVSAYQKLIFHEFIH